jgi:rod shape-determining protein MreC
MLRTALTHRKWLILMLSLVAVIILISPGLQRQPFHFIGAPATDFLVGLQTGVTVTAKSVGNVWRGYISLIHTKRQNQNLAEQVQRLRHENLQLREMAMENVRLQGLLDFEKTYPSQLTPAVVVGRDPTNWHKTVMINKGERDGLGVGMGVITPAGVVGKISRTTSSTSQVLLLTDHNSSIPAIIQRTRDEGLVEGTEAGRGRIKYLPILSDVRVGDIVMTSGLTGIFPKGLLIGQTTEIQKKGDELFQVAQIQPAADITRLEEVLVIVKP